MEAAYNLSAPKKATNVSINSDLLQQAKAFGINLSRALEDRLAELVAQQRRQLWLQENAEAIDAYNGRVAEQGVFSDGRRRF
ncbi:hypothetical protein JCM30471_14850 [Desulfuromonas carbonis]|uniref:type II toxin-antitoxin system CcdA family antitoxin n=1 Tax=Desulfuromonas sp. DDH964 TaxID=1823759 RepID=UPI00078C3C35|nr:type II toxin-antitoxin system CcdA family antitoxin [Desulfuromonas sp. DDH964]AMV73070.1 acetoacetyl-CoA synthase [Desulfuromonas sp. DDH964]